MRFVKDGPDIPTELVLEHEVGNVIFFCGAGISCQAGLPTFKELTEKIESQFPWMEDSLEAKARKDNAFDVSLNYLEQRINGGRRLLIQALIDHLSITKSSSAHTDLLKLSQNRQNQLKLITTNFDRLFEQTRTFKRLNIKHYCPPYLPFPKGNRWNGLVYLHGRLPQTISDFNEEDQIVLTSADFGRAYLTEGYAARFLTELFQNYHVCFIGYSLNDPIIRYLLEAVSAARSRGEKLHKAWVFDCCNDEQLPKQKDRWQLLGCEPIFYNRDEKQAHSKLYKTLHEWAHIHERGDVAKQEMLSQIAIKIPSDENKDKVLWALASNTAQFRKFSELTPSPPIQWLREISEYQELNSRIIDAAIVTEHSSVHAAETTKIAVNWLMHHLYEPELVIWACKRGGALHPFWKYRLQENLQPPTGLDPRDNVERIFHFWELAIHDRVGEIEPLYDFAEWVKQASSFPQGLHQKLHLYQLLAPIVKSASYNAEKDILMFNLSLRSGNPWRDYKHIQNKIPIGTIAAYIDTFEELLEESIQLRCSLCGITEWFDLPAIREHKQNKFVDDERTLVFFLREAWIDLNKVAPKQAREIAIKWASRSDDIFVRLALYAAAHCDDINFDTWGKWLSDRQGIILRTIAFRPEVCELLRLKGNSLGQTQLNELSYLILRYSHDDSLYLSKLWQSGAKLCEIAEYCVPDLKAFTYDDEYREEFFSWHWFETGLSKDQKCLEKKYLIIQHNCRLGYRVILHTLPQMIFFSRKFAV